MIKIGKEIFFFLPFFVCDKRNGMKRRKEMEIKEKCVQCVDIFMTIKTFLFFSEEEERKFGRKLCAFIIFYEHNVGCPLN